MILDDKFFTTNYRQASNKGILGNEHKYIAHATELELIGRKLEAIEAKAKNLDKLSDKKFDKLLAEKVALKHEMQDALQRTFQLLKNFYSNMNRGESIPMLVRQLTAYGIYCGMKYELYNEGMTQKYFLEKLGVNVKIAEKWGISPTQILENENYEHPTNPSGYMGQKRGNLGRSIREIAYQAGTYKYFVDCFGGSGTASTALPYHKTRKQVYNEYDKGVFTYLSCLHDYKKYIVFITLLLEIQKDMRDNNATALRNSINYDGVKAEEAILVPKQKPETIKTYNDIEKNKATDERYVPLVYWRFFRCVYLGADMSKILNVSWDADILVALSVFFIQRFAFNNFSGLNPTEITHMNEKDKGYKKVLSFIKSQTIKEQFDQFHTRFSKVDELRNEDANDVIRNCSNGIAKNGTSETKSSNAEVKGYADEAPLYYIDSPYLFTNGYNDSFDEKDMMRLIHNIAKSEGKFIFSCRELFPVTSDEEIDKLYSEYEDETTVDEETGDYVNTNAEETEIKQLGDMFDNYRLHKYLVDIFYQEFDPEKLYVAYVREPGVPKFQEIMITNFRLHPVENIFTVVPFMELYKKTQEKYNGIKPLVLES